MLSEINQINILCYHLYVNLKHQMNMYNKTKTESDIENKLVVTSRREGRGGEI